MPKISTLGPIGKRTRFLYTGSVKAGVTLEYTGKPKVSAQFFNMICRVFADTTAKGGFSKTNPTKGGLGEWIRDNSPKYNSQKLTPQHASHVAAILVHEGHAESDLDGNAVIIKFPPLPDGKQDNMVERLSERELVGFKELLMANEIYMEALVLLLIEKGILTKEELLGKIKQVQIGMTKA